MTGHDMIVIGGSAGSGEAIHALLASLPADLPAAVLVLTHRSSTGEEGVPDIYATVLMRSTRLPVIAATDGQRIKPGNIYIAPPKTYMLVEPGCLRVERSVDKNPNRNNIDALFRSAALEYGDRVVGVLLSGMLADGTAGAWQIRKHGGITIVQDPGEARYPSMPQSAMSDVPVHYCLPVAEIAPKLIQLAAKPPVPPDLRRVRVLIVEDERVVALKLANQLTDLGYDVAASVASGEEALAAIPGISPDIVLMDIHLAGSMTGTEAGGILWQRFGLPIIYLTAYSDEKTLTDAQPSMPYAFITKPYRPGQVYAAVRMALDRREREMEADQARAGTTDDTGNRMRTTEPDDGPNSIDP